MHAWVRSSTPNVDLQATISEVRPDGKETFVQSGWLRGNERKLDAAQEHAARARPEPAGGATSSPLPRDRFVKVTIPLYYQGHAYRAGSRIRVTIAAPERRPADLVVRRDASRSGTATVAIAHSKQMPSSLMLPVVPGVSVPTGLPPCPGLRGEPCRAYQPYQNRAATR